LFLYLDRDLIGDDDWGKARWQEHMQEICRPAGFEYAQGTWVWTMTEESGLLGFSGTRDIYSELILKGATNCKGTENMVLN
jgi:hypothetical protein